MNHSGGWPNEGNHTVLHGDWHVACKVRWMRGVHGAWGENLESGRAGPRKGSNGKWIDYTKSGVFAVGEGRK